MSSEFWLNGTSIYICLQEKLLNMTNCAKANELFMQIIIGNKIVLSPECFGGAVLEVVVAVSKILLTKISYFHWGGANDWQSV